MSKNPRKSKWKWFGSLSFVLAMVTAVSFILWPRPASIHFVLPSGYLGIFKIGSDKSSEMISLSSDGTYVYHIPNNGVLLVQDTKPLTWTESESAAYSNGQILPRISWPPEEPFDSELGFSIVSADSEGWFYGLIGTEKDLNDLYQNRDYSLGGIKDYGNSN